MEPKLSDLFLSSKSNRVTSFGQFKVRSKTANVFFNKPQFLEEGGGVLDIEVLSGQDVGNQ